MADFCYNPMQEALNPHREVIRHCYHPYHLIKLDFGGRWDYARVFHSTKNKQNAIEIVSLIKQLIELSGKYKTNIVITQQRDDKALLDYLNKKVKDYDLSWLEYYNAG